MTTRTLKELFNAFKRMPYYKNHAAASGAVHNYSKHEEALAAKMKEFGYSEYSKTGIKKKGFWHRWISFGNAPGFIHRTAVWNALGT